MWPRAFLALVVSTTGCHRDRTPDATVIRRDSSGIAIVESTRAAWGPAEGWRLAAEPSVVIDDATQVTEAAPLDPVNVWFTSTGDIVVADGDQSGWHAFLVYSASGDFVRKVSRDGQGPGEFGQLYFAFPYRADSLLGFDTTGQTLAVFGMDGGFSREFRVPQLAAPGARVRGTFGTMVQLLGSFADGTVLFTSRGNLAVSDPGFAWTERVLVRLAPEGSVHDSLGLERASQSWWTGTSVHLAPFAPMAHHLAGDSSYWVATGEMFEVREYRQDGTLRRIMRRPYERATVNAQDRRDVRRWARSHGGCASQEHPV